MPSRPPRAVTAAVEFDTGLGGPLPPGLYTLTLLATDAAGNTGRSKPVTVTVTAARVFRAQKIRQDDPDDPLQDCSWVYGPFDIPEGERFLLVKTASVTPGFDMDMHLYRDKNGNGRLDGAGELQAKSTSPTAAERIYIEAPAAGTYWLCCQGWRVEGDVGLLDVSIYPAGRFRAVTDIVPAGRVAEWPKAISGRFERRAGLDPASVRIRLKGIDVTDRCKVDAGGFSLDVYPGLGNDEDFAVEVGFNGPGREVPDARVDLPGRHGPAHAYRSRSGG